MTEIVKDTNFKIIAEGVKPDTKRRILLSKALSGEGVRYHVYTNNLGQIVLDPQVTIPASEAWLFENPAALASVRRGLTDVTEGRISEVDLDSL